MLAEWTAARRLRAVGRRALVVGCGLGEDAEHVAALGFDTVAFDIAPTAVRTARARHANSSVTYVVADLLEPPPEWRAAFDLVVESLTVQALPDDLRPRAIANVARMVGRGGTLLVIAAGRDEGTEADGPPWPLTRGEIEAFATDGLQAVRIEEIRDGGAPHGLRWRAELARRAA
jgi:SAM-dependent methyltransferase